MTLHNKYDKKILKKKLKEEDFKRITLSFYRYVNLHDLELLRDDLYHQWDALKIFGRVYLASEGINAQVSVPEFNWEKWITVLNSYDPFRNVDLKIAVEDDGKSFYKLIVRLRNKIVADGMDDGSVDVTNVGKHLSAKEFNEAMKDPATVVVDMRNHYESEVGHFRNALLPDADTFRQALPLVVDQLKNQKTQKILLYCTGGIRCEKASAYFKHEGFQDVNQLNGGIIHYARQVKAEGLQSEFIGKNFVFDERMGERITDEVISVCHQCGNSNDRHVNCANNDCHLLFIQCNECADKMNRCCTPECKSIVEMSFEEQVKLRRGKIKKESHSVYRSRLRPDLKTILKSREHTV